MIHEIKHIYNNEKSFKSYLRWKISEIKHELDWLYHRPVYAPEDIELVVLMFKVVELDKIFRSFLTKEEDKALMYFAFGNKKEKKPDKYYELYQSAYLKWQEIFFVGEKDYFNTEINSRYFAIVLKQLRMMNNVKKSELAMKMGVDRITITRYENGERLPTLEYTYRFCCLFDVSIDELIRLANIKFMRSRY